MRRYGDHVVRLAYSYLRDSEEAKDAAQEVFLRTFSSFAKFRANRSLYLDISCYCESLPGQAPEMPAACSNQL